MPDHKIFVTCDASDYQSSAVLAFGKMWEEARPVAFDSMTFKGAKLNYLIHEKELLVIIHILKKWCSDLLGVPFRVYTDHQTLENFDSQKHLSCQQVWWMEFLSQYKHTINYIDGKSNPCVDALSWMEFDKSLKTAALVLGIEADVELLQWICDGYETDLWCQKLLKTDIMPDST
jgi:hypothetical protein